MSTYQFRRKRRVDRPFPPQPDRCLNCGAPFDAQQQHGREPRPGDVTICTECGNLMAFGHDKRLRPLSPDELMLCSANRDIVMAQRLIMAKRKEKLQ
jgi:hypothetical protein